MAPAQRSHRADSRVDHADIVVLHTASGTRIELMRASYQRQVFPRHAHEYFTLGVVLRGTGTLWHRGAERMAYRGDVVVIPPGEIHTGGPARGAGGLSYVALHLPDDVFAIHDGARRFHGGCVPDFAVAVIRDPAIGAELRRLDAAIRAAQVGNVADDGTADDALCSAIGLLLSRHAEAARENEITVPAREPDLVRVTREVIADCYADKSQTSLRALACRAGVTPCHLVRVFTRTVGLSPHRYLVQTRVRRASQLLARGFPSAFVAAVTGFVDQSHLTTHFKRYVGTTPASYQRCLGRGAPG